MNFEDLPAEILLLIFSHLTANDLRVSSQVNKRWNSISSDPTLWKGLIHSTRSKDRLNPVSNLQPTDWRGLYRELGFLNVSRYHYESLIFKGLKASSTDGHDDSQSISQTLSLNRKFWSSTGNSDPNSNEYLIYQLIQPISIVLSVKIIPFKAAFQVGMPIYAPKWLKISVGFSPTEMYYSTNLFPVQNIDEEQQFHLEPNLVCGGFLRLDLIGRYQTQPIDELYYTVLKYVSVQGIPLGNITEKKVLCQSLTEFAFHNKFTKHLPDFNLDPSNFLSEKSAEKEKQEMVQDDNDNDETSESMKWGEMAETFRQQMQPYLSMIQEKKKKMEEIHDLIRRGNNKEAIQQLTSGQMTEYRTRETVQLLKQSGGILMYLNGLLKQSITLNEIEALCLTENAIISNQQGLIELCIRTGLIRCSLELGDFVRSHNLRLAALIYLNGGIPDKVVECYILLKRYQEIGDLVQRLHMEPNWVNILTGLKTSSLFSALDFGCFLMSRGLIDPVQVLRISGLPAPESGNLIAYLGRQRDALQALPTEQNNQIADQDDDEELDDDEPFSQ